MLKIVGFIIVTASVLGGYVLSHGELLTLWQPYELLIIGGAALGAFVVSNPPHVILEVFRATFRCLLGQRYGQALYMDLLSLLDTTSCGTVTSGVMPLAWMTRPAGV